MYSLSRAGSASDAATANWLMQRVPEGTWVLQVKVIIYIHIYVYTFLCMYIYTNTYIYIHLYIHIGFT